MDFIIPLSKSISCISDTFVFTFIILKFSSEPMLIFASSNFKNEWKVKLALKELLLQGKEYHEDVYNKMSLQFMQKYERTRSFKVINHNEVIVKSKVWHQKKKQKNYILKC